MRVPPVGDRLTLNRLVEYCADMAQTFNMTATFHALGDPVRSEIVQRLATQGDATVNELAALFPISLQAVSKHIKVLEAAGVVSQRREGRHRPVHLERRRVESATDWLRSRLDELEARYQSLDEVLAEERNHT